MNNNGLRVIFLGGVGEIGKNMTLLESNGEIIVLDAGLTFPSEEMPGIDVVIPDVSYLRDNLSKVKGIVLTHGHEDHIGAMPYVLKSIKAPVFGTKLTLTLLENKLREHRLNNIALNCIKEGASFKLGCFTIEFIKVSHSIAGSVALSVTTPAGTVFFTGDFKIDYTPIDNETINLARIAEIGRKGVLLLMCDSTNVERKGYTMSERTVGETLDRLFAENIEKRLIIATFASNVHRVQQILDLAQKYKRKVALSGRSMINVAEAAVKIGELKTDPNLIVDIDKISKIPDKNLVIVSTGSQGEPMSALTRMAAGDFNKVTIGSNDTIIISASPIPGNERMIYRVINNLCKKGAKVIYEMLADVHVSGHACQEELKLMHTLVRPKYFIPVHGETRHLLQHKELAVKLGMRESNVVVPELGMSVEFDRRGMRRGNSVQAGAVLVDGLEFGDTNSVVLRDRRHLAEDGMVVVVVGIEHASGQVNSGPDIISRGFTYSAKENEEFTRSAKEVVLASLAKCDLKEMSGYGEAKRALSRDLRNHLQKKTKRSPMILPIFID